MVARSVFEVALKTTATNTAIQIHVVFVFNCLAYASCRASPGINPAAETNTSAAMGGIRTIKEQPSLPPGS